MNLPSWLDIPKILMLSGLVVFVTQGAKEFIPDKWVKFSAILIGIVVSIAFAFYVPSGAISWAKVIIDGVIAGVASWGGYSFLSGKGGAFTLPSK